MKHFYKENKEFDDRLLLIDEYENSVTYRQLSEFSARIAQHIPARSFVFILTSNTQGSVLGYLSCLRNRIVPLLLNRNIDDSLLTRLLNLYSPQFILVPDDMAANFSEFAFEYSEYGYTVLKTNYEKSYELYEELALCLTTSGSTGSPKLVRQSYNNIAVNANQIVQCLNIDASERPITTLPMNYTYGLSIINSHVLAGATILLTDKGIIQKEFWNFFKEQGATSFGGVSYTYEMLDRLRFFNMNLPSLRYISQSGSKLSPELHKKFAEFSQKSGIKFIAMYGASEATARISYLPFERSAEKYGSVGIAVPGGKFVLIDENGNEFAKPRVTGELVYKGENVTLGYAEQGADLIKGDERNGLLETGDMAQFDEDGFLYIVGRKKRFLKMYGNRVNLDEVETLLKTRFKHTDCACGGIDDHMYIFITDENIQNDVKNYISEITHLNKAAFKVVVIEAVPKNDSGKTIYADLEKYYD